MFGNEFNETIQTETRTPAAEPVSDKEATTTVNDPKTDAVIDVPAVPVDQIEIVEGHNPRKFRSQRVMDAMRESIRQQGVLQPVTVRPTPTEGTNAGCPYQLVAGETRLILAREIGLTQIPALIKVMDDQQMLAAASAENTQRAAMSIIEEGEAASRLMAQHNNDTETVLKTLGWGSKKKLDSRMAITRCIDAVAQALVDERISIAHAEILAGLRDAAQEQALALVLDKGLTAGELKEQVEQASLSLSRAIFDKTECQSCPYNSEVQSSLFDTGMESGQCMNKTCYTAKTQEALQAKKEQLEESVSRVEFDQNIPKGSTGVLAVSGEQGVGKDQFQNGCLSCTHYGAIISTQKEAIGATSTHVCFNLTCREQKIAAYQGVIASDKQGEITEQDDSAEQGAKAGNTAKTKTAKGATKGSAKGDSAGKGDGKPASSANPAAISKKVDMTNHRAIRQAAAKRVADNERYQRMMAIVALIGQAGVGPHSDFGKVLNKSDRTSVNSKSVRGTWEALEVLSDEDQVTLMGELSARCVGEALDAGVSEQSLEAQGNIEDSNSFSAIAGAIVRGDDQADVSEALVVDASYLDLHTKPVIEIMLREAGFDSHYEGEHGEGSFKKLMKDSKKAIIEAVKASNFSFGGYLPPSLRQNIGKKQ